MVVLCLAAKGTDSRMYDSLDLLEKKCNPTERGKSRDIAGLQ